MCVRSKFVTLFLLPLICLSACKAGTAANTAAASQEKAQAPLTTVSAATGGKVVFGSMPGVTTQPAALAKMLSMVHNNCGEKPVIGRPFQFSGSNSVGVFFTVTDHPEGNLPLAGLVIATSTGPNQVQAGMIYDLASRFGQTVNPMLQQLTGVWHPGAASAAIGSSNGVGAVSSANSPGVAGAAPAAALTRVTLPDNSASVGVPAGWQVVKGSSGGTIALTGPHGDYENLDMGITALDTSNRIVQQLERSGTENAYKGKWVFYPANADLTKVFPDIYQQIRANAGTAPANLQIAKIQAVPGSQGERCVQVNGQMNPNGQGAQELDAVLCASAPNAGGEYGFTLSTAVLPVAYANQDRATADAILGSLQVNTTMLKQQAAAKAAPGIAANNQRIVAQAQQYIGFINQEGASATARMNASHVANSAEQASWDAQQNTNAQNGQAFTNYLLDQSVIQNNFTGAQSTQWNSAANALVQANPNKYSYVSTPNYIPGVSY